MQRDAGILMKPPSSFSANRSRAVTAPGSTRRSSLGFVDAVLLLHGLALAAKRIYVLVSPVTFLLACAPWHVEFLRLVYKIWTLGGCTAWRLR